MLEENFDALFTFDKNLQFQQSFVKYPIAVLILNAEDNSYLTLKNLFPKLKIFWHFLCLLVPPK